jgi:hypothetical protein
MMTIPEPPCPAKDMVLAGSPGGIPVDGPGPFALRPPPPPPPVDECP